MKKTKTVRKHKQVIVIRKDLNMRKGKMVAQGGHSVGKVFFDLMHWTENGDFVLPAKYITEAMKAWLTDKFTKICVSVNSEAELLEVYNKAKEKGLVCSLITDAGLTEFGGVATNTCCAIGPAWEEEVNEITGKLQLL